ncbi:YD repeat-containing protein [Planomonospora sphaerica]|uniref:YD repeat-containing protein n=1 Tax=Planomonospora sphaerica TaxID=161355 RepID=A0A161LPI3_9ACTN|nr:LamG-like jellyroll fold domain-containing protein [Planomonospora sphaerica]GAT68126.1 YD repeat-containing protein [Planomonospora sphaerica]
MVVTLSALTASLLVAGGSQPAQADPEPSTAPSAPSATAFPRPEDPDAALRAGVAEARKQNKAVEVTAAFTETSRTWAFPDGSLKTESYSGPTQVKQDDGSWAWIDTTLTEKDVLLAPKVGGPAHVEFSLGGEGKPFASMERGDGQRIGLSWDKSLPRPVVNGNVATYPDAAGPAADLVVTALPTGFRHDVVLRKRPSGPVEIRIPVESQALTLAKSKRGGLQLTDDKGKLVAEAPQPVMWDSTGAGEQSPKSTTAPRTAPVSTSVVKEKGSRVLVLKPDAGWLADPATTFPVVVDPTSTITVKTDTVLASGADCSTYDQPGATLLRIGGQRSSCNAVQGWNYYRSYLHFDVASMVGKPIHSAALQLWRTESPACHLRGTGKVYANRVLSAWTAGKMTWSNKPSTGIDSVATPCPTTNVTTPGAMSWPVTDWVKKWAGGVPNHGIELMGSTEELVNNWDNYSAYFHSAEMTGAGATPPKLIVQYILPPEIPTVTAESVDSMDGDHAIVRKSSVKVDYKSSSVDGKNLDYYVSVVDSTAPLPAWTTGGGEVGKWSFTEGVENADSTGNGNAMIFVLGRHSWIDGKDGKAVLLSGDVNKPSSGSTGPVVRTDKSFSAAGWVRLDVGTHTIPLISQSGTVNSAFNIGYDSGSRKWYMEMYHADSGTERTKVESPSAAQLGAWTHLAGVYDATAKKIRLYVNGVLAGETDHTAAPWHADKLFSLGDGRHAGGGYTSVKAAYDEIRAYNRALSSAEVQWMLNLAPPTNANLPSGQAASITYDVSNVDSFKISVKACINGAKPMACNESPYYRITTDAPMLPTDTETGMADPTRPILSGMVNRPSGGPVTAKYYLYDSSGAPVGAAPLGQRVIDGGQRASFQLPADTVQAGRAYTWQMQACVSGSDGASEVCTSKTAPVGFTTPGTPAEPSAEDVRNVTLGKDNFVIKTTKTDPTACDGQPCPLTDSDTIQVGGTGQDKMASVIGIKLDEVPDGAAFIEAILKPGSAFCQGNTCPDGVMLNVSGLKSGVTNTTKGSDLAADTDPADVHDLSLSTGQTDLKDSAAMWYVLTTEHAQPISLGGPSAAEQISLALAYVLPGPPSKVLNLMAVGGDSGLVASWGLPEDTGGMMLLDGYDVEIADADGNVASTWETEHPWISVGQLGNDITYTVRVRARTKFGAGKWMTASATTKAVPPPPSPGSGNGGSRCLDEAPAATTASGQRAADSDTATSSSVDEYRQRVIDYFRVQDAVLEGKASTVWDAPGVMPSDPTTAALSLLNSRLVAYKADLDKRGVVRSDSATELISVVPQPGPDGSVRVTVAAKRTWKEAASTRTLSIATSGETPGQVEPSKPTISIIVFGCNGGIIDVELPEDANQDNTDLHDLDSDCSGSIPISTSAAATSFSTAATASNCGAESGSGYCSGCHFQAHGNERGNHPDEYRISKSARMECTISEPLGAKGWYWNSTVRSDWRRSAPPIVDEDEVWLIDDVVTSFSLISKNKKYGLEVGPSGEIRKASAFAKMLTGWSKDSAKPQERTPNTTVHMASRACFIHDSFAASASLGISGGREGTPTVTGGIDLELDNEKKEDCQGTDISGDRIDLSNKVKHISSVPPVKAMCLENAASTCTVNQYWQRFTNNIKVDFSWTKKDGRGSKDRARYHYDTWSHDLWFIISREIDTDVFGDTKEWARLLECSVTSTRRKNFPHQTL